MKFSKKIKPKWEKPEKPAALKAMIEAQLERTENAELLQYLLGDSVKQKFSSRCTKMLLEVLCVFCWRLDF